MRRPERGRILRIGGRDTHVLRERGGRVPVVLLHGCGSLAEEILPPFARGGGYDLIAPDRPGYGYSDPFDTGDGNEPAAWLEGLLDALRLPRVILVSHSLAAAFALSFAIARPERLAGLLLVAPFCRPTPHQAMPLLRAAIAPVVGRFVREAVLPKAAPWIGPGLLAAAMRPNGVPAYLDTFPYAHAGRPSAVLAMASELLAFNGRMTDVAAALPALPIPLAVVHGAEDRTAEPDWHLPWLQSLAPQATVDILEGVGHAPHHADPDRMRAALDGLAGRSRLRLSA